MSEGVEPDPLVGQTFRGYRIEHLIARGGMGAVYRARDEVLPNVCKVIKVLLPELAADAAIRAFVLDRFEREAFAVSVLRHDNIVGIHSVGKLDNGQPCMLMDYVEGQRLDEVIRFYKGRVPPYRVMHYMCHVARGLDFAHALGIVHRDLKPANIMVCPTDNDPHFCKLLDFGVAKFTRPIAAGQLVHTMGGMGLGTPCYMAVEQFRHADEATAVSDVYSLAIIIWLMVTGELPWGQHDTSNPVGLSVLYETQRDKAPNPPPAGTLGPAWERTLRAALSPDPDERPPSVRHFMVELAIGLEPENPHVKGGVEILRSIAPKFIAESGPDVETVRDTPHRTIMVAWPRVEAPVRAAAAGLLTRPALPRHVQPGQPTPILRAGSGAELPAASASVPPASATTLGASNGVLRPSRRTSNGWKFASLAVVAASITTVVLFAVVSGRDRPVAATAPPPSITAPTVGTTPPRVASPLAPTVPPVSIAPTANPTPSKSAAPHMTSTIPTVNETTIPAVPTTWAATTPTVTPSAPSQTNTKTRAAPRSSPSPAASTKERSEKPRSEKPPVQKRTFDPDAPRDGEE